MIQLYVHVEMYNVTIVIISLFISTLYYFSDLHINFFIYIFDINSLRKYHSRLYSIIENGRDCYNYFKRK